MGNTFRTISAPVGIRNGQSMMPNQPEDLDTVSDLFDRIATAKGGKADSAGLWVDERSSLIRQVTGQISLFQTANKLPTVDGVIDPNGRTLNLMNQLAGDSPVPVDGITASVVAAPGGLSETLDRLYPVADPDSLPGTASLKPACVKALASRRLVRVDGSSINWFGVVVPQTGPAGGLGSVPHLNFTPTPIQGGYLDNNYDTFAGWAKLWDDYTAVIGCQMAAYGGSQVLVIPFYQTSQQQNMGNFLNNWVDVVAAVVTAAVNSIDPFRLRDTFTFDSIVSSSFSNGWVAHKQFNTQAAGAEAMTNVLFDLDGQAGGSNWRPDNGVIYLNRRPPGGTNPVDAMLWYVGGRWGSEFQKMYPGGINTHAACRNHLLYHGLKKYC
jgi:hypothetical protein